MQALQTAGASVWHQGLWLNDYNEWPEDPSDTDPVYILPESVVLICLQICPEISFNFQLPVGSALGKAVAESLKARSQDHTASASAEFSSIPGAPGYASAQEYPTCGPQRLCK